VTLKLREPLAGQWRLVGTLTGVGDDAVTLELSEPAPSRTVTLEHKVIAEAKRAVTW
jgi:ribosome maturation factor RimP